MNACHWQTIGVCQQGKPPITNFSIVTLSIDAALLLPPASPATGKSSSSALAHAKGVLAVDGLTGFWLIHSVPQFAPPAGVTGTKYSYPPNGKENGQTAMCVSFRTPAELDHIVSQLLCMRPNVYAMRVSTEATSISPKLLDLEARRWPRGVKESIQQVVSINGQKFTSFSRNSKSEHKDLYLEIIAPELASNLLVESWRRGSGDPLPSNCTYKYKVNNVESVELKFSSSAATRTTIPWSYLEDHSKWAVAVNKAFTCVGDINRMASQYKRGGGSMCFPDPDVWNIVRNSIHAVESCPRVQFSPQNKRQNQVPKASPTRRKSSSGRNKSPLLPYFGVIDMYSIFHMTYDVLACLTGNACLT